MGNTTDMAKVTQMLDAGWQVQIKKDVGYVARAKHPNPLAFQRSVDGYVATLIESGWKEDAARDIAAADFDLNNKTVYTDDPSAPERALTRLAYKVHGEII